MDACPLEVVVFEVRPGLVAGHRRAAVSEVDPGLVAEHRWAVVSEVGPDLVVEDRWAVVSGVEGFPVVAWAEASGVSSMRFWDED